MFHLEISRLWPEIKAKSKVLYSRCKHLFLMFITKKFQTLVNWTIFEILVNRWLISSLLYTRTVWYGWINILLKNMILDLLSHKTSPDMGLFIIAEFLTCLLNSFWDIVLSKRSATSSMFLMQYSIYTKTSKYFAEIGFLK